MLSILFKSHVIKYSGTGRVSKDTQRALKHLRHSECTRRALRGHSDTQVLGGHSDSTRALRHLRPLGHSGTWGLKVLRHLGT